MSAVMQKVRRKQQKQRKQIQLKQTQQEQKQQKKQRNWNQVIFVGLVGESVFISGSFKKRRKIH